MVKFVERINTTLIMLLHESYLRQKVRDLFRKYENVEYMMDIQFALLNLSLIRFWFDVLHFYYVDMYCSL